MPSYKRSYKRRPKTRRRKRPALSLIRSFPQTGLPSAVLMKHKYTDSYSFTTTTTPNTQFYRLNSTFDPYESGLGHQPYYSDQMFALYDRCIVYGCKVVLKCSAGTNQAIVGFKDQIDTTAVSDATMACERPSVKYCLMNAGGKAGYLSKYYAINELFGVNKNMILNGEMDFSHSGSANPSRQWYLQIFGQHPDGSSTCTVQYTVELTYYCKWIDRKRQNQS